MGRGARCGRDAVERDAAQRATRGSGGAGSGPRLRLGGGGDARRRASARRWAAVMGGGHGVLSSRVRDESGVLVGARSAQRSGVHPLRLVLRCCMRSGADMGVPQSGKKFDNFWGTRVRGVGALFRVRPAHRHRAFSRCDNCMARPRFSPTESAKNIQNSAHVIPTRRTAVIPNYARFPVSAHTAGTVITAASPRYF